MDEDEIVAAPDSQEPAEPTEPQTSVEPEEDLQALREKAALADELAEKNSQLFARAKKAEGFELVDGKWVKAAKPVPKATKQADDLSGKDILALSTSGITEDEDIDFLKEAASLKKTTIGEALKDPTVKALLKGKQEERETATAASTGSSRRAPSERKGSDILASATAGNMPASGKDTRKFVRASLGLSD